MPRDELVKWINENKAGYSKDELKDYLVKNNWDAQEVQDALDSVWGASDQASSPNRKKGLGGGAAALLIFIFFVIGIVGGFFGGMYYQKSITPATEDCPKCETEVNENTSKNINSENNNSLKNTNSAKNYNLENDNETNTNSFNTNSKNYNDNDNVNEEDNTTSSNLSAAEYLDEVIPLLEEMDEVSKVVADATEGSSVTDENILIIQDSSDLFRSMLRNLSKINAPEEFDSYNDLLTEALEKYISACTDLGTGYVTNEDALISQGEDKISEAADLLHDAADELE